MDSLIFSYGGGFYVDESNYGDLSKLFNNKDKSDIINKNNKIVWDNSPVSISGIENNQDSLESKTKDISFVNKFSPNIFHLQSKEVDNIPASPIKDILSL